MFRATERHLPHRGRLRSFRGPTLNELYRSFRVGDTLTLANPALTEERLAGGEPGCAYASSDERVQVRAVGFLSRLEDPVANVTLRHARGSSRVSGRTWGGTRSSGFEAEGRPLSAPH